MIFDPTIPLAENIRRITIEMLIDFGMSREEAEARAIVRRSKQPGVDFQCAALVG